MVPLSPPLRYHAQQILRRQKRVGNDLLLSENGSAFHLVAPLSDSGALGFNLYPLSWWFSSPLSLFGVFSDLTGEGGVSGSLFVKIYLIILLVFFLLSFDRVQKP